MKLYEKLTLELEDLDRVIAECTKTLASAPEGKITITNQNGFMYARLWLNSDKRKSKYLSFYRDTETIKEYCKKAYCKKLLKAALKQKEVIERFLSSYKTDLYRSVLNKFKYVGRIITPFEQPSKKEEQIDEEEIRLMKEMRQLCDEFLKLKGL